MPRRSERGFGVRIRRKAPIRLYRFQDYFEGFESAPPVRELFGGRTDQVLRNLKIEFFSPPFGYMGTSDEDGHLVIGTHHLRTSDLRTLYLDVVHELCHVKQFRAGRPLFDRKRKYFDTPTEIEAYEFTVKEGKRLGMTNPELVEYLKVEWVEPKDHLRFARRLGLLGRPARGRSGRRARRARVSR
jgi:hypothetical protein